MYACSELFCVLTNVSNKFVFRGFPLRGGSSPLSPTPACAPGNSLNVQIPLAEKNILFNSFFRKASSLWNALPIVVKSSASFSSFKFRLESFYCDLKRNCWHLYDSNPRRTSLRCRLRLGHSALNLNKRTYRLYSRGSRETEEHLLLNCTLHSALRVDLMQSVKSI